jgi:hypothetical protein
MLSQKKKREGPTDTTLLVEVVSCKSLRPGIGLDLTVDPFVIIFDGEHEVHRTDSVANK